jgi:hypothetical protein
MGGSAPATNKIGEAQFAAGTVPKATQATAADLQAFDRTQAQNQRIAQGLGAFAEGIKGINFNTSESNAMQSQDQAEKYLKMLEMLQKNQKEGLNFMPNMPFQIRSSGENAVYDAWGNAAKTLASSAMGGVGKMYGM